MVVCLISWFSHTELYQSLLSSISGSAPARHPHHSTLTHPYHLSAGYTPSASPVWYGNQSASQLYHFDSNEWGVVSEGERNRVIVYRSDEDGFEVNKSEKKISQSERLSLFFIVR